MAEAEIAEIWRNPAPAPRSTEVPKSTGWQVFWLQGHLTNCAFPGCPSGIHAAFIACYSCGSAEEFHPLPYSPHSRAAPAVF